MAKAVFDAIPCGRGLISRFATDLAFAGLSFLWQKAFFMQFPVAGAQFRVLPQISENFSLFARHVCLFVNNLIFAHFMSCSVKG